MTSKATPTRRWRRRCSPRSASPRTRTRTRNRESRNPPGRALPARTPARTPAAGPACVSPRGALDALVSALKHTHGRDVTREQARALVGETRDSHAYAVSESSSRSVDDVSSETGDTRSREKESAVDVGAVTTFTHVPTRREFRARRLAVGETGAAAPASGPPLWHAACAAAEGAGAPAVAAAARKLLKLGADPGRGRLEARTLPARDARAGHVRGRAPRARAQHPLFAARPRLVARERNRQRSREGSVEARRRLFRLLRRFVVSGLAETRLGRSRPAGGAARAGRVRGGGRAGPGAVPGDERGPERGLGRRCLPRSGRADSALGRR